MATISKEQYEMLRGRKTDQFVVSKRGKKYYIHVKPEKSNRPPTEAQVEHRRRFGEQAKARAKARWGG
jgi:hypothetical protein